ncbi:GvpL/GvpF family gas vesicle protein [Amycolatopsis benzoatilytica]|uniref:GvpL/GvpF family gas vesicle protein n=1 Tax=Amycolatopsis benzoatilytica TaxID=346045 RepID=UPI00037F5E2A|nr:GvpL/GvpF family gas vesicle protein [Amycolatopsis benzoatilytica]
MPADGLWLYGVTRAANRLETPGVAGETPRTVTAAGLTATVGDVPLDLFGADALQRDLEDLDWLAAVARAHDAVIVALAEQGPVAPVRLATVYRDDESVRSAVEARSGQFSRTLDRVSGRTEWGVKAFLTAAPDPPAPAASSGVAYLTRRRNALAARETRHQQASDEVRRLHLALCELSAESRTHAPQSRALTADDRPMVLNAAYLVDNRESARFADTVAQWRSQALAVQLTGPWPPYSFSALDEQ